MANKKDKLCLVYIRLVGQNNDGEYEYDFYLSTTPEDVWGFEWDKTPASYCVDTTPEVSTYKEIRRIKTNIPFTLIQDNTCFSMEDCVKGIVALACENIFNYEEYPTPYRIVFHFGEPIEDVMEKLESRDEKSEDDE